MIIFINVKSNDSIFYLKGVLEESGQTARLLKHLNEDVLRSLAKFLKPFGEGSKLLQGEKHPTAPMPVVVTSKLRASVVETVEDDASMAALKRRAHALVEEKMVPAVAMRHKVATVLWPPFRTLKMLSEEEKQEVGSLPWSFGICTPPPSPSQARFLNFGCAGVC